MGFGFVVARFGLFLQVLQMGQSNLQARPYGLSFWFGTALILLGVIVNLVCAFLLNVGPQHSQEHGHVHHHEHHHDLNLRAAYLHVLADAVTTLMAILALLGGKFLHFLIVGFDLSRDGRAIRESVLRLNDRDRLWRPTRAPAHCDRNTYRQTNRTHLTSPTGCGPLANPRRSARSLIARGLIRAAALETFGDSPLD